MLWLCVQLLRIKKILYRENDLLDIGLWCTKQGNKVQWDSTINSPILLQIKKSIQRQSCQYAWVGRRNQQPDNYMIFRSHIIV